MKIKRSIEDITISETQIEEFKKSIKKDLIDERKTISDEIVEKRLQSKVYEVAKQQTLNAQGDNSLHHKITHTVDRDT